ncbi:hypothetical protein [Nostoc sp.]|uniref:hypothetical protein n=1 Tax=Nostoc sp. TaxID=1180 RepID=UPI002FF442B9
MKEKNVGWVEQSETQQNQGFFVLAYPVGSCYVPQTPLACLSAPPNAVAPQPTPKFIPIIYFPSPSSDARVKF